MKKQELIKQLNTKDKIRGKAYLSAKRFHAGDNHWYDDEPKYYTIFYPTFTWEHRLNFILLYI